VALESTHLSIQWAPRAVSPGIKRPRREAVVKNGGARPPFIHISALLIKHGENITFNMDYCEDHSLLRCDAVQSGRNLLTFGRNVLPCLQSRCVCHVNN
jgi:hypothetical protein